MSESIPIVAHVEVRLTELENQQVQQTAETLRKGYPALRPDPAFADLHVTGPVTGRAFHCDDFSVIQNPNGVLGLPAFQERSRLRAIDGDIMVTSDPHDAAYANYCRDQLGLGCVEWLTPQPVCDPVHLAEACWEDREIRRTLVHSIRADELRFLHPHQGTDSTWRLALLLSRSAHRPLKVIGAPPELNRFVNDKGRFAQLVQGMFGDQSIPSTEMIWNRAIAADRIRRFADAGSTVALKLPGSAGGEGNVNLPMDRVRGRSIVEIEQVIHELLDGFGYQTGDELLATVWETDVLSAPSAQTWIPPVGQGIPVLEGFFNQFIVEQHGSFAGAVPADLPPHVADTAARRCLMLASVFQLLGYVGRCSFDLVLVGDSPDTAAVEFIECNGRWGGTSLPMTLMNRLFGDWRRKPFASHVVKIRGSGRISWSRWMQLLGAECYHRSTGEGRFLLLHPRILAVEDQFSLITLADDYSDSMNAAHRQFIARVDQLLRDEPQLSTMTESSASTT